MTYLYLYGGAIGETLFGLHAARLLNEHDPSAKLVFVSTRENTFVRDFLAPVPYASFFTLPKKNLGAWIALVSLAFTAHKVLVHEPMSAEMPLWWRIILRLATLRGGSVEVRCVPMPTNHRIPARVHQVGFNPKTDQIFDTIPGILKEWGAPVVPSPVHLDAALYGPRLLREKPYVVFHFFAPVHRRSVVVDHAQKILAAAEQKFPEHELLLTCAAADRQRADLMVEGTHAKILQDLLPATLVQTLAGADVFVGVDTGVTHLACCLGVPSVVLGNNSNPCWLPTYAPQASILLELKRCGCNGDKTGECNQETPEGVSYRCLYDIPTERVIATMQSKLTAKG